MKNQIVIVFLLTAFYSFAQEKNTKSDDLNIETDSISNGLDGDKNSFNGNIGSPKRKKYANCYFGQENRSSYGLYDRQLANTGTVVPKCHDEGTIVIEVIVNKNGDVTKASFSPKGSNTSSKCLQEAAIATAYKYRWQPDSNAPDNQVGFIVINFRTGE